MATRRTGVEGLSQVVDAAGTTGGDHWHRHRIGHGAGELQGVARLGAITIHGGEQDLASPEGHHLPGPGHRIEARVLAATFDVHIPTPTSSGPGIDGHHDALAAKALGAAGHQLGVAHGR